MVDLIDTLTIEGRSTGLDTMVSQVDRVTAAQTRAATAGEVLSSSQERVTRSTLSVEKGLRSYTLALDPLAKAQSQVERGERLIATARAQGVSVGDSALSALANARKRHDELSGAMNDNTTAAGLNRMQQMEMMHVTKALADEFAASGVSLRAFAMEGGRIGEIFSMGSGGVGGTLRALGGMIAPVVLNPLTLLAVGFGAAGYAAFQFSEQQERLERSLNGVGRAAAVNADQLRSLGLSGARSGGLGAGQGIELSGQYASAGISGANISTLVGDTQRFSRAFGLDLEKASDEVTKIVSDAGLGAFEKRFGAASFSTKEMVRSLEASGHYIEAETEKTRLFDEQVKKATDTTWSIAKAWDGVKASISDATQSLGRFAEKKINGPSLQDQLGAARGNYFFLNAQRRGSASSYPGEDAARRRVEELERQIDEERKKTADAARDLDLNRRSQRAGSIIDELTPDASRYRGLLEKHDALKPFVDSEEALKKLGDRAADARATFDQLTYQLTHFQTAVQRIAEDSALAARQSDAWTFAERAAVAADKARLDVLRESGDVAKAAASAEAARNALIAEGNKKADDLKHAADQETELRGLSPYAAGRLRIQQQFRDFREQNVPEKGDLAPYSAPAISAFNRAKDSVNALADAAAHAAGALGGKGSSSIPIFASGGLDLARAREAIASIESSGDYGAIGPRTKSGDRAYGRYQIMGNNLPTFANGMSPSDFLSNPAAQDAAFDKMFSGLFSKFGNLNDAASAYFTGRPLSKGANAADVLGTTGAGYVGKFDRAYNGASNDNVPVLKSTSGAVSQDAESQRLANYDYSQTAQKIKDANIALEAQNRALDASSASWTKGAYEIGRAAEEQKLINEFTAQGVPLTESLRSQIAQTADGYGNLAKRTEDAKLAQQNLISEMDTLRSTSRDALGTFTSDLRQGKSASEALKDSLSHIADKLIGLAEDQLISGLFGKAGKAGGGIFGDAIGGIFGNIGHMFGFADGGIMTSRGPIPLNRYADGGIASSPQLAMFGEGRGPEAYVPLKGGAIPVTVRMPGQPNPGIGSAAPKVTINNNAAGVTVTPELTRGEMIFHIDQRIAANNARQSQADRRSA